MGGVAGLGRLSTCTKVGRECTFVTTPSHPLRRTQTLREEKAVKRHIPCLPPRFSSITHRPHTPINFIARLYYFQRTGARLPLVVPSLTPCARPCEFMPFPLHANPPPRSVPILPPTTPFTPHSPARYHIYRVCAFLPHPHPCRTSHLDRPLAYRPTALLSCPPLEYPRTGVLHPQTP